MEKETTSKQLEQFTEFESKYRIEDSTLRKFKDIVCGLEVDRFLYVEGFDFYLTKNEDEFIRVRVPKSDATEELELTIKKKRKDSNNIERFEVNLKVVPGQEKNAFRFVEAAGYTHNFWIFKTCHVYFLKDAVLSFYSVKSDKNVWDTFFEIEVSEDIKGEDEAWAVIKKYEDIFADIGITAQKRLRKSLFEMYKR